LLVDEVIVTTQALLPGEALTSWGFLALSAALAVLSLLLDWIGKRSGLTVLTALVGAFFLAALRGEVPGAGDLLLGVLLSLL
jgi:hypothetical protein